MVDASEDQKELQSGVAVPSFVVATPIQDMLPGVDTLADVDVSLPGGLCCTHLRLLQCLESPLEGNACPTDSLDAENGGFVDVALPRKLECVHACLLHSLKPLVGSANSPHSLVAKGGGFADVAPLG